MLDITQVAQEPDGSLQAQVTLNLKVSSAEPLPFLGPGEQLYQGKAKGSIAGILAGHTGWLLAGSLERPPVPCGVEKRRKPACLCCFTLGSFSWAGCC